MGQKQKILFIFNFVNLLCFVGSSVATWACPDICVCYKSQLRVSCVGNGLTFLQTNFPKDTVELEVVNFKIQTINRAYLLGMKNLVELSIVNAHLRHIENKTFQGLSRLQHLDVSNNLLKSVSKATFKGLVSLRYLDLSSNKISHIEGAFLELRSVQQLNLYNNKLQTLTSSTFKGLRDVQLLNLQSNQIIRIDNETFQCLPNLVHLILSNNPITQVLHLNLSASQLEFIDFSDIGLNDIPHNLSPNLQDLRLAQNNLSLVTKEDMELYPYLRLLILDDNKIRKIQDDAMGGLDNLEQLWLIGNGLKSVPTELPSNLLTLVLEQNNIATISRNSFNELKHLQQLYLKRNKIRKLPTCAFCKIPTVKYLDLQANLIETLHTGTFRNLTQLEMLDLSQNPLTTITKGSFDDLRNLKKLKLSNIRFPVQIDEDIFEPLKKLETLELNNSPEFAQKVSQNPHMLESLRNIKVLSIAHNGLTNITPDFFQLLPNLQAVKMSGNPWNCTVPSILLLRDWIKHSDIHFHDVDSVKCNAPEKLLNRQVQDLSDDEIPSYETSPSEKWNDRKTKSKSDQIKQQHATVQQAALTSEIYYRSTKLTPFNQVTSSKSGDLAPLILSGTQSISSQFPHTTASIAEPLQGTVKVPETGLSSSESSSGQNNNKNPKDLLPNVTVMPVDRPSLIINPKSGTNQHTYGGPATINNETLILKIVAYPDNPHRNSEPNDSNVSTNNYISNPTVETEIQTIPIQQESEDKTTLIVASSLTALILLIMVIIICAYVLCRRNEGHIGACCCKSKLDSKVAYYTHRDEVDINLASKEKSGALANSINGVCNTEPLTERHLSDSAEQIGYIDM